MSTNNVFVPCRNLGYVTNELPLQLRYIKMRNEYLITTCVGKAFHTYGISHFGLYSVSGIHSDNITCMSSDTYHTYTACNKCIYAWRRGAELKHTYIGHEFCIKLMLPFGPHLISIDDECNVKIWNIKDASLSIDLTFDKAVFNITAIVHPATYLNKVLFGSEQGSLQLWNLNTTKLIYTFNGWGSSVTCLVQAPAVDIVAIGLKNGSIIIHNLKFDETLMKFCQDWGLVTAISFRMDDNPIMTSGSEQGHLTFWNLDEQRVCYHLQAHDAAVTGIAFIPGEPLLLTSSPDNSLKLWIFDKSDGGPRLLRIREGHGASINRIRFHGANGHNILSAGNDSTLRIFNTQTEQFNKSLGKASLNRKISKKRKKFIEDALIMSPIVHFTSETTRETEWDNIGALHLDCPIVTTWSYSKICMSDKKLLPERFKRKHVTMDLNVTASSLCLTHCGHFIIIGYSTGHIDRFNIQSGEWRATYGNPVAHKCAVRGISTDVLNQIVISGAGDLTLKIWRFKQNANDDALQIINLPESINLMRSHHESNMLAVALEDFSIFVVDLMFCRIIRKFYGHTSTITDLTFSMDSRWIISASMDRSIRTWDIPTNNLIDQFSTETACISLDMSPTGKFLATAHVDQYGIFLWSNRTLYNRITLNPLEPIAEPPLVALPETVSINVNRRQQNRIDTNLKVKPSNLEIEHLGNDMKHMLSLSGLESSRWANLLDIETIQKRNKPIQGVKLGVDAPFFLPTVASLNSFHFDLNKSEQAVSEFSKCSTAALSTAVLSEFAKELLLCKSTNNFCNALSKFKSFVPIVINIEIKSLAPDNGGSVDLLEQFLQMIAFMLNSHTDFDLAIAYLGAFLNVHDRLLLSLPKVQQRLSDLNHFHMKEWNKLQKQFLFTLCILHNLKQM